MDMEYPLSDLELARRLERTEARANAAFVEARARAQPGCGAGWTEVAGAYAMFDGVGSPLTQSFGVGVFDPVGSAELERLEAFFAERGAEVFHEVSPMADPAVLGVLAERGYHPVELTSVLFRPSAGGPGADGPLVVRRTGEEEAALWAGVAAEGWSSEGESIVEFMRGFGEITARAEGTHCFLAELDGEPVAAGALTLGRRRGAPGRGEHRSRGAAARRATGPPGRAPPLRSGEWVPPGDDGGAPGERVAAQRGAAGVPHRLHAHQVAPPVVTAPFPIRPATPDDAPAIGALVRSLARYFLADRSARGTRKRSSAPWSPG
jgi:hypothetical protein